MSRLGPAVVRWHQSRAGTRGLLVHTQHRAQELYSLCGAEQPVKVRVSAQGVEQGKGDVGTSLPPI